jgi:DNA helicase HerA-like ATPase
MTLTQVQATALLQFEQSESLGKVISVDTANVVVNVDDNSRLNKLQVNRLVALESGKGGQYLIGIIAKITRSIEENKTSPRFPGNEQQDFSLINLVKILLIGTFFDTRDQKKNVFQRTLESVPEIDANCYPIEGEILTKFMQVIAHTQTTEGHLNIGKYTLDEHATAYLNGNKLFQRHAVIVGSTGSGKSWCTARVIEQIAKLSFGNAVLFDLHREYKPLASEGITHLRIASPFDVDQKHTLDDGVLYLPYWLLGYEDLVSMLVDRSDQNAPNQAMVMSRAITDSKKQYLSEKGKEDVLKNFTVDSPVPFSLEGVLQELSDLNTEMVSGSSGRDKQGDFHGKLSRLIARFESKISDRRLGFLFSSHPEIMEYDYLNKILNKLMSPDNGRVKIIDFSEVPSDILPLVISLVARLIFNTQQWSFSENRHPISIFCDEAHLYIPDRVQNGIDEHSLETFERIAKEGRKYGVGLVVISQRPSEVSKTVLSQCSNFIAMRLTNAEDQAVIKRLLPDSLGTFTDILPMLDVGEALVVGDASLLPSRVRVDKPESKPDSGTIEFWKKWQSEKPKSNLDEAIEAWRRQSMMSGKTKDATKVA